MRILQRYATYLILVNWYEIEGLYESEYQYEHELTSYLSVVTGRFMYDKL